MSLVVNNGPLPEHGIVPMGQNGRKFQWGTFKWNASDATGELPVLMHQVEAVIFTYAASPAADEQHYCPQLASGLFSVPAAGTITVNRNGAVKTANLAMSFLVIGR